VKITDHDVQRLVFRILSTMKEKKLVTFKAEEAKVRQRMIEVFQKNLDDEQKLDLEVKAFLEQHEREMQGDVSYHKMFQLVKKKLAKERGFVL
jgi:hypothetical protein